VVLFCVEFVLCHSFCLFMDLTIKLFVSIIRLICRRGTVMCISCGLASDVGVIRYLDGSEMACVAG